MTKYLLNEKPKLLYVDDERPNLVAFRALLRDTYDVLIAESAEQAIELLQNNDIPLVVSDQRMPGMTGTELLEKVASDFPDCARMILTGYADIEAVITAINCGQIYYYFKKPWNEAEVRLTLSNALEAVITRRKLIESEQRFRGTFEQAGLGIAHLELQGRIMRANARLRHFLGASENELIGSPLSTWFPQFDSIELETVASGRKPMLVREDSLTTAQGKRRSRITVSVSLDRKGLPDYLIFLLDDITEHLLLEEQLRQSQKLEAIGALAGGVAHDFNNLLTPIMGYAHIIEQKLPENDPLRDKARGISKAAMSAKALTSQLLSFGRKQDLELNRQELSSIITSFYEILRRTIRENIEIKLKLPSQEILVKADKWQLEQVFLNLAINAQDAIIGNGTISIETSQVYLDGEEADIHPEMLPGSYALLMFSDTGSGMSAETQAHIFEPFFTTKKDGHGTGLGLATVYGIVKQHEGFLNVVSEHGQGTIFRIYLPILAGKTREPTTARGDRQQNFSGTGTILVVEDNEMVREIVKEILESAGYTILEASSPHQALELTKNPELEIDLLVSDIVMPDMNGQELYRQLLVRRRDLLAVFISGYAKNINLNQDAPENEIYILPKPFTSDMLLNLVKRTIQGGVQATAQII